MTCGAETLHAPMVLNVGFQYHSGQSLFFDTNHMDAIVVNATALDRSGALNILKQFVENIPDDNHEWLVFVPGNVSLRTANRHVRLKSVFGVKPMHKRLWWDAFGLNSWLKKHDVNPIACISLQNTGFRVSKKNIPHFIYYHQSLPFYPYHWNPLKGPERILWFYKNIYPFFVRLFLRKETVVFAQLDFIKKGFVKRFNHRPEKVEVYSPSVAKVSNGASLATLLPDRLHLFYPATAHFYKNHSVLYEALKRLGGKAHLYVTVPSAEEYVTSTGVIPFEQVCAMYRTCDALVFPSYIETFGLPLLEAAQTGMPILAADVPYAREVLAGYDGVKFVPYDDSGAWAEAIAKMEKGKRYAPIDVSDRRGWNHLFESIMNTISL